MSFLIVKGEGKNRSKTGVIRIGNNINNLSELVNTPSSGFLKFSVVRNSIPPTGNRVALPNRPLKTFAVSRKASRILVFAWRTFALRADMFGFLFCFQTAFVFALDSFFWNCYYPINNLLGGNNAQDYGY
jgi:hypothetical protein